MPRHIVCLTFDFDAMSSFMARGLTTPTPISRGEFRMVGAELVRANETIRALTGKTARGYRSPSWDLSPHTGAM